jgi:hypothetical protein
VTSQNLDSFRRETDIHMNMEHISTIFLLQKEDTHSNERNWEGFTENIFVLSLKMARRMAQQNVDALSLLF